MKIDSLKVIEGIKRVLELFLSTEIPLRLTDSGNTESDHSRSFHTAHTSFNGEQDERYGTASEECDSLWKSMAQERY